MVDRIKRLLTAPAQEWPRIDADPMTAKGVFISWVVPLAAIGPVAYLIRELFFGHSFLGITIRTSPTAAVSGAVSQYVISLIGVWVAALIVSALAPNFGGTKNTDSAMKVVAFSWTASWLAGVFFAVPGLMFLMLLGLYSLYLLWIGLPILMKSPSDKTPAYPAVALVIGIIVHVVGTQVAFAVVRDMSGPSLVDSSTVSGTLTVPGVGAVDMAKANEAVARMKAATDRIQADAATGNKTAVPVAALQAMLPASIGSFTRGDVETQSGGIGGLNGSHAEGRYTAGDQSFRLSGADMGAVGALATLGGAMNVQSSKQTATGYEKTEMVGGAMVSERWNTQSNSGSYGTMVASRFMVSAEGSAPNVDTLKQAVAAVDTGRLAALAK
jgi:hypothetical protein